ncbi:MAG: S8 family serine peptidase [Candidatus Eisenbacteria bacterium]|nr:S8 family serine peptidase [Candidatus Eisenbacteria bacterium]
MHSARLLGFSLVFLALLGAAVGGEGLRAPDPRGATVTDREDAFGGDSSAGKVALSPAGEARALVEGGRSRILIRWRGKPDHAAMDRAGFLLTQYVPGGAWITRVDENADWEAVEGAILWAGAIHGETKIDPAVAERGAGKTGGVAEVRVKLHGDVGLGEGARLIRLLGGSVRGARSVFHGFDVEVPSAALEELAGRDEVLWIGAPLPPPVPANDGIRVNGNVDSALAAPCALTGAGARPGIWDGGRVDAHTDFTGRLTVVDAASVSDHATHVAGTLGGSGAMSAVRGGTSLQWKGVAPACSLFSYDFYGDVPSEYGSAIAVYDIDLTSNSWVLDVDEAGYHNCYLYGDYDAYAPEFDEVVTGVFGKRIPVVCAAGNERNDGDCSIDARSGYACVPPPATAKNVITVGAIHTNNSAMTTFSGYGPVDDGRIKPDIVAGGCQSTWDYSIRSTWPGDTYGANYYCGTSMATPAVSGAVCLLIECWRTGRGDRLEAHEAWEPGKAAAGADADPLPSTLKAILIGTADDLGSPGPDYRFGFGRMNVMRAVERTCDGTIVEDSLTDGSTSDWSFSVPAGFPDIRVTLVWDDPAAVPLADPALVNDLDLVLIPPSGPPCYPWVLDPANPALGASTGEDHLNNVEQVEVSAPVAGVWTARITGTDVPVGVYQKFSLVGIDTLPPAEPDSFETDAAEDSSIGIGWERPAALDYAGALLVRSATAIAWAPVDGEAYAPGQSLGGGAIVVDTGDACATVDSGLAPGTLYYYAAFSYDRAKNYSPASTTERSTTGGCTAVLLGGDVPAALRLHPARPNPFNPTTHLRFDMPRSGRVKLAVYDIAGRLVRTLLDEEVGAGRYEETWNGDDGRGSPAASGVYFARLHALDRVETSKLILVR